MGTRGSTERDYKAEMLIESITARELVHVSILLISQSMQVCFDDSTNVTGFVGPLARRRYGRSKAEKKWFL